MRTRPRLAGRLPLAAIALLSMGCDSVVPPDVDFAAARCSTVIDDGIEGMPALELGAILEQTRPDGKPEATGQAYVQAMRLAIQELNDHRDIAGKRFRLRVCDTRADWATGGGQVTRDLAKWLVDRGVQAIVSDASSDTQTIQAVSVPKGVLLLAISATSAELTKLPDNGLVWRVAPSDIYQGAVLAHLAASKIPAEAKITVVAVQSPYGDGLVDALGKQLGNRLTVHTFDSDGKGLATAVQEAGTDAPQALIVVAGPAHSVQIANARAKIPALASIGLYFADGACDTELAKQPLDAGVSLQGVHCTRPGQPPTPVYKLFQERFKKTFGWDPAEVAYTQHAFDAVYSVALAHAWALRPGGGGKADGKALAEGLRHLSKGEAHSYKPSEITAMTSTLLKGQDIDVEGASGLLDFNPDTGEAPSDYEDWTLGPKGELVSIQYYAVQDPGGGQKYVVLPVDVTP